MNDVTIPFRSPTVNATAELVKTGHRKLHSIHAFSINDEDVFLHFYNVAAASSVTVGTTVPDYTVIIPAGDTNLRGVIAEAYGEAPLVFQKGIVIAVTEEDDGGLTAPDTDCFVGLRIS